MSDIITVKNLSKIYNVSHEKARYKSFRDDIVNFVKNPFSSFSEKKEKFYALKDISFSVKQGETIGIIGPNGAGKSTLLKILSRITPPSKGEIKLNGRISSLLEVGTGFHPELTGRENIFLSGAVLGMQQAEIKRKFDEIVDFAGVEKFLDTPVKHFSSGMYTRLAFSVAAHLEPEILIVDEVLAVGDAAFQKKCLGKMSEIGKEGRTVVFVSHNMGAIKRLCSTTLLLDQGKIVKKGKTSTVVNRYIITSQKSNFIRTWTKKERMPQNDSIALSSVSLTNERGVIIKELSTDNSFLINIKYNIKRPNSFVGLTIIIYDDQNNCVFSSINNHEINWYGKSMSVGIYNSTCKIPGKLLNNGWYSLSVNLFSKNFSDSVMVSDILHFEAYDGNKVRGDYFGEYDGAIRPLLEWKTIKI